MSIRHRILDLHEENILAIKPHAAPWTVRSVTQLWVQDEERYDPEEVEDPEGKFPDFIKEPTAGVDGVGWGFDIPRHAAYDYDPPGSHAPVPLHQRPPTLWESCQWWHMIKDTLEDVSPLSGRPLWETHTPVVIAHTLENTAREHQVLHWDYRHAQGIAKCTSISQWLTLKYLELIGHGLAGDGPYGRRKILLHQGATNEGLEEFLNYLDDRKMGPVFDIRAGGFRRAAWKQTGRAVIKALEGISKFARGNPALKTALLELADSARYVVYNSSNSYWGMGVHCNKDPPRVGQDGGCNWWGLAVMVAAQQLKATGEYPEDDGSDTDSQVAASGVSPPAPDADQDMQDVSNAAVAGGSVTSPPNKVARQGDDDDDSSAGEASNQDSGASGPRLGGYGRGRGRGGAPAAAAGPVPGQGRGRGRRPPPV
jgi:hypothetical protein